MLNNTKVYEFPLNERVRNFMRLENLFAQIQHFNAHGTIWDSHASLLVLIELLNILDRYDVNNELVKELERNINTLNNLRDIVAINQNKLQETLDLTMMQLDSIRNMKSKMSKMLRENELISTIRQRNAITTTINNFEIPSYCYWLNQPAQNRQQQLQQWLEDSIPLQSAIVLLLQLIRNSTNSENCMAVTGFFQNSLTGHQACQMIRVELPEKTEYFPEISGNKHRISIRFLTYAHTKQRPTQITDDVMFDISYCGF